MHISFLWDTCSQTVDTELFPLHSCFLSIVLFKIAFHPVPVPGSSHPESLSCDSSASFHTGFLQVRHFKSRLLEDDSSSVHRLVQNVRAPGEVGGRDHPTSPHCESHHAPQCLSQAAPCTHGQLWFLCFMECRSLEMQGVFMFKGKSLHSEWHRSTPHPGPSSLIQRGDSKQPRWFLFAEWQLPNTNPTEDNLTSAHMQAWSCSCV